MKMLRNRHCCLFKDLNAKGVLYKSISCSVGEDAFVVFESYRRRLKHSEQKTDRKVKSRIKNK